MKLRCDPPGESHLWAGQPRKEHFSSWVFFRKEGNPSMERKKVCSTYFGVKNSHLHEINLWVFGAYIGEL